MVSSLQLGLAAGALGLLAGGFAGYQYADGQAAKVIVKSMSAEEKRRLASYDQLARDAARLAGERDKARTDLEAVRAVQPPTLTKYVYRRIEVPSGATEVNCPIVTAGVDFVSLWNAAGNAYNQMPGTNGSHGPADAAGVQPTR